MLRRFNSNLLAGLLVAGLTMMSANAQDPFGAASDPFGGLSDPAPAAADPASATAATPAATIDTESDPLILAIRRTNPTTTAELGNAIRNVMNLGRPDEAKRYIAKLLAGGPDPDLLVALHRQLGSALFMRIARDPRYAPEGPTLSKLALDAAYESARDPARLAELIVKLSDKEAAVRYAALVDLRSGGTAAIVALIGVLADDSRRAEHAVVRSALVELRELSVEPLIGALQTKDAALLAQVIVVLSRLGAVQVTPHLLRPYFVPPPESEIRRAAEYGLTKLLGEVPARADAEFFLARRAQEYLSGKLPGRLDEEDMLTLWDWDAAQKVPVERRYPGDTAAMMMAVRLASDLYAIEPQQVDHRRLYLTTLLESAKRQNGLDQPLATGEGTAHAAAAAMGVEAIADLLDHTLRNNHLAATIGAIEVLGDFGTVELLHGPAGRPSPLALGLQHPDRRVRFASLQTIMKLDPTEPFAGSSYLPEALGYFASTVGTRRALVVHPRTDQAQTLVGLLNELGFQADTAQLGRQALHLAVRVPDYELVLVSDAVDGPAVGELIQHLRRDARTAKLPIGLMARQDSFESMERLTEFDPLAETFPRPHDSTGVALAVRRLLLRAGNDLVTHEERLTQAVASMGHFMKLAEKSQNYPFYDLLRQQPALEAALNVAPLAEQAAQTLGYLGSPAAQRALVTLASQNARRLSERQAAAAAMSTAIERRGLLLTKSEILLQYDRYNQSQTLDPETQAVLSALLDAIEVPTRLQADPGATAAEPE